MFYIIPKDLLKIRHNVINQDDVSIEIFINPQNIVLMNYFSSYFQKIFFNYIINMKSTVRFVVILFKTLSS